MCYKQKCKVVSLNLAHPVCLSSFDEPLFLPKSRNQAKFRQNLTLQQFKVI